jgi:hypothetical protein
LSVALNKTELTEAERLFVEAICDAKTVAQAVEYAGLAHPRQGYTLLRLPKILIAIEAEHRLRIATRGAAIGFERLFDCAQGAQPSTGPQVDAAKYLTGLAGYVAPKAAEARDVGDVLADVSLDELRAIIDKREASAAQRAKPVDATVLALEDDKLLNLLD